MRRDLDTWKFAFPFKGFTYADFHWVKLKITYVSVRIVQHVGQVALN